MSNVVRIGTRDSVLAMWQAHFVRDEIEKLGLETEIVPINTKGDQNTVVPLYEFGVTGIFTKSLDIALLEDRIDIAVHSMKDVPTILPKGISEFAIPQRGGIHDTMVYNGSPEDFLNNSSRVIATSSLRRKAQWLYRYPNDTITGIRGNVITRLEKLASNPWDGAVFAEVGLKRIEKLPTHSMRLDWMVPAAAQGALLIVGKTENTELQNRLASLNDENTAAAVTIERDFMHTLEAGCTAPIGAHAEVRDQHIHFHGVVNSIDGSQQLEIKESVAWDDREHFGAKCAQTILGQGAKEILDEIKSSQ
ncbi:hydroxymethylbilane synthase [bacterium SCSIO 12643]|nr:hydroxymethylbilane synthase [bacterium SCSIO 12643]